MLAMLQYCCKMAIRALANLRIKDSQLAIN